MATNNTNPFAGLASAISGSRLAVAAPEQEQNVSQRMNRAEFRANARDRSAPLAQVAATGPEAPTPQPPFIAQGASSMSPSNPGPAFASLSAIRLSRPRAASSPSPQSPPANGAASANGPAKSTVSNLLSRTSTNLGPDLGDLIVDDDADALSRPSSSFSFARQQSGAAPARQFAYTDEQNSVIECDDRLIVVDAFAGCAKTTTAIGYAAHRPRTRMLYLCLNTANAEEAKRRFGPNVTASTTHSVAWGAMRPNKARVTQSWRPMLIMDQLRLNDSRAANNTLRVLNAFFNSADIELSEKHAVEAQEERDLSPSEVMNAVAFASLAWKRMNDPGDTMQMPHDAYLKMFALRAPKLDYDTIICDEWQDANPVTAQIVAGQKHVKLLCIGDRHQSIYAFRGSINAMEKFSLGATRFHLSQTFRFGPRVAAVANTLLSEFKGETVPIRGMGQDGMWNPKRTTTLSRTNAELFRLAAPRRGAGVHWVGGKVNKQTGAWLDGCENYRLSGVMDAYHLYSRNRSLIEDQLMRTKFATWAEYAKYAADSGDGEARIVVKVVEEFTHDIPALIADIKRNAVRESSDADLTLTTVHKSKGLEWDCVQISNDFEVLEDTEAKLAQCANAVIPTQDINLLYVGMTRAKSALKLNAETTGWLKKLPEHRKARDAAISRARAHLAKQQALLRGESVFASPS